VVPCCSRAAASAARWPAPASWARRSSSAAAARPPALAAWVACSSQVGLLGLSMMGRELGARARAREGGGTGGGGTQACILSRFLLFHARPLSPTPDLSEPLPSWVWTLSLPCSWLQGCRPRIGPQPRDHCHRSDGPQGHRPAMIWARPSPGFWGCWRPVALGGGGEQGAAPAQDASPVLHMHCERAEDAWGRWLCHCNGSSSPCKGCARRSHDLPSTMRRGDCRPSVPTQVFLTSRAARLHALTWLDQGPADCLRHPGLARPVFCMSLVSAVPATTWAPTVLPCLVGEGAAVPCCGRPANKCVQSGCAAQIPRGN